MLPLRLCALILLAINLLAYLIMWIDKALAIKKQRRIPELYLFLMALLFAAPGIYLGMCRPLYHKAGKPVFKYGIPLLVLVNAVCIIFLLSL